MLRRDFLRGAGAFAAAGSLNLAAERKLNLLLIEASGWRAGDGDLITPNLEELAGEGIRFDRAYSCCPLQGPSHAALMSGRFPFASGVQGNASLGSELKKAGYRTAVVGSSVDLGVDFLTQKKPGPWFLLVGLDAPRIAKARDSRSITLRPNVPEDMRAQAEAEYSAYSARCFALDKSIGDLLAALDEQHLAEDTIVLFTSDCGEMLGSQGLEEADVPFEEAVRVPLVIRHPGLRAADRRSDLLVSNVDLMPTLLGFCGAAIPNGVQGGDFSQLIATGEGDRPESIYSAGHLGAGDEWRMVVRGLDKLVVDRKLDVTHLYNLGQDPFELENRAQDSSQELKRDELSALLRDWMRRAGDGMDASGLKKRG